jgi:hypothetical protein
LGVFFFQPPWFVSYFSFDGEIGVRWGRKGKEGGLEVREIEWEGGVESCSNWEKVKVIPWLSFWE